MLPHQFRDNAPCQLGSSYGMRRPFSLGNIILLKEKGGMSHFLGRLIRSLGVPKEREVWDIQGGRKDKLFYFFPSTFLRII